MHKLSIVIPVYNEDQTIIEVVRKVQAVNLPGLKKEIILVNDGSTDNSKEKIKKLAIGKSEIKFYNSIINLGKGAAVRIGLTKASGDIIIIQDADLELNPEEYHQILLPILTGQAKVVYGSRFKNKSNRIPFKTKLANLFLVSLTNLLFSGNLSDMETAYKAFSREVVDGIRLRALEFEFEPEITARIRQKGIMITEVPISYKPRSVNEGKKLRFKDGLEAVYTLVRCYLYR